ncbi:hypothetical protein CEXT_6011 [Caerostris extrusa]|uniref:Uncharacterized protein n=1 Tax=Caerostris extrusa TaxID=172846 RepID=A0AAV4TP02_CAEEX|nr:hypothetical protein CEXT_6011 [Caerostris extrusa]
MPLTEVTEIQLTTTSPTNHDSTLTSPLEEHVSSWHTKGHDVKKYCFRRPSSPTTIIVVDYSHSCSAVLLKTVQKSYSNSCQLQSFAVQEVLQP